MKIEALVPSIFSVITQPRESRAIFGNSANSIIFSPLDRHWRSPDCNRRSPDWLRPRCDRRYSYVLSDLNDWSLHLHLSLLSLRLPRCLHPDSRNFPHLLRDPLDGLLLALRQEVEVPTEIEASKWLTSRLVKEELREVAWEGPR